MSRSPKRRAATAAGLRSGFEHTIAQALDAAGVEYEYERESFSWLEKVPRAVCLECDGPAYAKRSYTPDFFLSSGVIVEAKGRFTAKDRKISLAMKEQGRDIRLVFQFDNKLSRTSKSRYSDWCVKNDIQYALKEVPESWT